ncbi:uncharacterized protein N7515_001768 [Penicillium bovifimosum]|uniref:F-box domain-containing protein n=1 Tax=Penicillium bovifimosum TaxID=126998 RepID=A0A9W9L8P6_9EURO|nr:uncharacterized protein N7515_001768 [Penicillium bovifimosum]KAJ5142981.1 hypothetical protein N7515_001768 [Penicillium bovifimosum]
MDSVSILEAFKAISDKRSREEILNELVGSLRSDEIRQVKSRLNNIKLQCDVVAGLPHEIVTMVVPHLNVEDVVVFRRVSKRWNEIFTDTTVVRTALRTHTGQNVTHSESLDALIRRRFRAERGYPATVVTMPHDIRGKWEALLTPNREGLASVLVSDTLISAISQRGYCHVWKWPTGEFKSFRIPSPSVTHHVAHGSKILLSFEHSKDFSEVVHFCFDSGLSRAVTVKNSVAILFVSLHASEDQFSLISACKTSGEPFDYREQPLCREDHKLQVHKFSVHDNEFVCSWTQDQDLPCGRHGWRLSKDRHGVDRECRHPSQSSRLLWSIYEYTIDDSEDDEDDVFSYKPTAREYSSVHLSLEANDHITVHCTYQAEHSNFINAYLDRPGQGTELMFRYTKGTDDRKFQVHLGSEILTRSSASTTNVLSFNVKRWLFPPPIDDCTTIVADGDFLIFWYRYDDMYIWCFDENWEPSGPLKKKNLGRRWPRI